LLLTLLARNDALARNDNAMFSLEPETKLYFGNQRHLKDTKEIGEWKTNKKTNGFNKAGKEAYEWVFLTAALELQGRAKKCVVMLSLILKVIIQTKRLAVIINTCVAMAHLQRA
jgi:hypothetical protein